ncbi:MAG: TATA-box-binding protein [Candidatus Hodarchaeota archaeon]
MRELKINKEDFDYKEVLDYKINNVVASVSLKISEKIDLAQIARKLNEVEYSPERFPGLILRVDKPKSTVLIFSTGNMVVTGIKNVSNADKTVKNIIKKIRKIGIKLPDPKIIIQNIVATGDLHSSIDLNKATIIMDNVMFEPEIFPGLIYRMQDPKTVFLIFSTGKVVCTGAKNEEKIEKALLKLNQMVHDLNITREPSKESNYEIIFK